MLPTGLGVFAYCGVPAGESSPRPREGSFSTSNIVSNASAGSYG